MISWWFGSAICMCTVSGVNSLSRSLQFPFFYPLTKKTAVQHELTLRGATAEERVSWIELSLDFVATHGWQPGWIHSELTLGKLARRFQVFVVRLLKANRIPIRAISSLHLSEFGFNRVASIYLHKKFVFPDKVLAFLLQCSRSNPGEWLDPTQKKHVALYWKPSFDVLLWLLKAHNLLHVDLS